MHSPFIFELLTQVIHAPKKYYAFEEIDKIRLMLERNNYEINVSDFGAGSHLNNSKKRKISDIAKNAAKPKKLGELLFRLCEYSKPEFALELGTSLGISSLYQYSAAKNAKWLTMEGCPETAKIAKKVFTSFKANNIEIVVGDFAQTLNPTIEEFPRLDYAFFDGNHQKQPTIDYFLSALPKAHENSLFIFDDIHWSKGMEEAWEFIKNHPSVTVSIDLFWIGLVFFKKNQEKEHLILR